MRMFCQDIWVMGKAMCLLVPFIELTVSHTSVLTILAITVERSVTTSPPQSNMLFHSLPSSHRFSWELELERIMLITVATATVNTWYIKLNPSFHSIIISIWVWSKNFSRKIKMHKIWWNMTEKFSLQQSQCTAVSDPPGSLCFSIKLNDISSKMEINISIQYSNILI